MTLEKLSKTVDFVQATTPSNANDGETWLDTSQSPPQLKVFDGSANAFVRPRSVQNLDAPVSNAGATQSDIANGVDSSNLSDDITSGRTRELLLSSLLSSQDNPVPEVQDPLNIQTALSSKFQKSNSDFEIDSGGDSETVDFGDIGGPTASYEDVGFYFTPDVNLSDITVGVDINSNPTITDVSLIRTSDSSTIATKSGSFTAGDSITITESLTAGTEYLFRTTSQSNTDKAQNKDVFPKSGQFVEVNDGFNVVSGSSFRQPRAITFGSISVTKAPKLSARITDKFAVPKTGPDDFKAWNAIQAQDVTTGGSTSADPVEFEILDSTDTALNSTRIPKSRLADSSFSLRNRLYSEDAGSNGQSTFTVSTTGAGGDFGIPILTANSVKQNGSLIDSANWQFDGVDTITVDTSNVTISAGDTIDVKYDFDISDRTLKPRAYLSRESISETSPSISHFRYEYLTGFDGVGNAVDWAGKTPKIDGLHGNVNNFAVSVSGSGYIVGVLLTASDADANFTISIDGTELKTGTIQNYNAHQTTANLRKMTSTFSPIFRFNTSFRIEQQSQSLSNDTGMTVVYVLD